MPTNSLRAIRTIDVRGLRFLDEVVHISFDVDDLGSIWVYQFGWLRRQGESNVFRCKPGGGAAQVFGVPSFLQRQPFPLFRVGGGRLLLLGESRHFSRQPQGFALDMEGRVVATYHFRLVPLDAALDPWGGLWVAGVERGSDEQAPLRMERYGMDGRCSNSWALQGWTAGQFTCLAWGEEELLLGGVDDLGVSRLQSWGLDGGLRWSLSQGRGPVLGLGWTPREGLWAMDSQGRLSCVEASSMSPIELLDPEGHRLGGSRGIRFLYKRLFTFSSKWEWIWEFVL